VAALRALAARDTELACPCKDPLATQFLGLKYRLLLALIPTRALRRLLDVRAPGSYCYTIARTRHFDEILLAALRGGIEQLVLLGAGYDSRPFRFERELSRTAIFEVDHPATQAR
jgi:methyltransferase (TIGR00027 family)